jgi:hypothetical protein
VAAADPDQHVEQIGRGDHGHHGVPASGNVIGGPGRPGSSPLAEPGHGYGGGGFRGGFGTGRGAGRAAGGDNAYNPYTGNVTR